MRQRTHFFSVGLCLLIGCCAVVSALQARMESSNYIIESDVFSSGGNESAESTNYTIRDTIGEDIILSATSTSASYGLKAGFRELYPDQYVTLSVPVTAISLGTLDATSVKTATQTMTASTNAAAGFSLTVSGATLTKGSDTIDAIGGTETTSVPGTEQFGLNAVANTGFGADESGTAPIGAAANHYNVADSFAFLSGDAIATSTGPVNPTTFTISYMANISTNTVEGSYSTTLTYSATGNF